jgi:hypothetical protein
LPHYRIAVLPHSKTLFMAELFESKYVNLTMYASASTANVRSRYWIPKSGEADNVMKVVARGDPVGVANGKYFRDGQYNWFMVGWKENGQAQYGFVRSDVVTFKEPANPSQTQTTTVVPTVSPTTNDWKDPIPDLPVDNNAKTTTSNNWGKKILIGFGVLALLGGGYWAYKTYYQHDSSIDEPENSSGRGRKHPNSKAAGAKRP